MCFPAQCQKCKKHSFRGCGKHLSTIFAGKKPEELCSCPENTAVVEFKKTMKN